MKELLARGEKECLVEALRRTHGDLDRAASLLQIDRADLDARLRNQRIDSVSPDAASWKSVEL